MIFLIEGTLLYQWRTFTDGMDSNVNSQESSPTKVHTRYVKDGDWCCEACLWTDWVHIGTMQAIEISKALTINADKFLEVAAKHYAAIPKTSLYAQRFIKDLNVSSHKDLNELSKQPQEIEKACMEAFAAEGGEKRESMLRRQESLSSDRKKKFMTSLSQSMSGMFS